MFETKQKERKTRIQSFDNSSEHSTFRTDISDEKCTSTTATGTIITNEQMKYTSFIQPNTVHDCTKMADKEGSRSASNQQHQMVFSKRKSQSSDSINSDDYDEALLRRRRKRVRTIIEKRLQDNVKDPEVLQKNINVIENQLFHFRLYENQTVFLNDDCRQQTDPSSQSKRTESSNTPMDDDCMSVCVHDHVNRDSTTATCCGSNLDDSRDDEMIMIRLKAYLQMMLSISIKKRNEKYSTKLAHKNDRFRILRNFLKKMDEKACIIDTSLSNRFCSRCSISDSKTAAAENTTPTTSIYERICNVVYEIQKVRMTLSFKHPTKKIPKEISQLLFHTTLLYAYEHSPVEQFSTLPWVEMLHEAERNMYEFQQQYKKRRSSYVTSCVEMDTTANVNNETIDYMYDPSGKILSLRCTACVGSACVL